MKGLAERVLGFKAPCIVGFGLLGNYKPDGLTSWFCFVFFHHVNHLNQKHILYSPVN